MRTKPAESTIRKQSIVPLYMQIANDLIEQIKAGKIKPQERLPTEQQMIAHYNASRVTIRLAIKHLISQGLVASRQGKGTFALDSVIKHELGEFVGFYEQLQLQGLQPETDLLGMEVDPDSLPHGASDLASTARHVVAFSRRYKIDGKPFAEINAWFATNHIPAWEYVARNPVLGIVMREFDSAIVSAELGILAIKAGAKHARSLETGKLDPVLLLRRSSYLDKRQLVEYSEIYIRADRYEFRFNTKGPISITSGIHFLGKIDSIGQSRKAAK